MTLALDGPVFWGKEGRGTVGFVAIGSESVASVVIRKRGLDVENMRVYERDINAGATPRTGRIDQIHLEQGAILAINVTLPSL